MMIGKNYNESGELIFHQSSRVEYVCKKYDKQPPGGLKHIQAAHERTPEKGQSKHELLLL